MLHKHSGMRMCGVHVYQVYSNISFYTDVQNIKIVKKRDVFNTQAHVLERSRTHSKMG